MVSTKTTTQINSRIADCNVTGVFADVQEEQQSTNYSSLAENDKGKFLLNTLFRAKARLLLIFIIGPGEWLRHLNLYKFMNINSRPRMTWDFLHFHSGV